MDLASLVSLCGDIGPFQGSTSIDRSWLDALLRSLDDVQGLPVFALVGTRSIAMGVHAALLDYGCTVIRLGWIAAWLLR